MSVSIDKRPRWRLVFLCVAVTLLCRIAVFVAAPHSERDYYHDSYWNIAVNIVESGEYAVTDDIPTTKRGPVSELPWIAAVALGGEEPGIAVNVIEWCFDALSTILVFYLTLVLLGSQAYALWAGLAFGLSAPNAWLTVGLNVEPLFTFLLLATVTTGVLAAHSKRVSHSLLLGLAGGMLVLCRSTGLLVVVLLGALLAWRTRRSWKKGGRLLAAGLFAFSLTVAPWTLRNQLEFGKPVVGSCHSGLALWHTYWYVDSAEYWLYRPSSASKLAWAERYTGRPVPQDSVTGPAFYRFLARHDLDECEFDSTAQEYALDIVGNSPWRSVGRAGFNYLAFWTHLSKTAHVSVLEAALALHNTAYLILFLFGAPAVVRRSREFGVMIIGLVLVYSVVHAVVISLWRYSAPLMPFVFLVSSVPINKILSRFLPTNIRTSIER